jgi:tetratricopeptide (TPR) repeat protein
MLVFVATPIFSAAILLSARTTWSSMSIFLVVTTFSALGHHLPGFMRAYGDPELFSRYKWRFLIAPPLVYLIFLYYVHHQWQGMVLLIMTWGIWHGMMQHYGFVRIYDAKKGGTSTWTARLDWWLALSWWVAIVIRSPEYSHDFLRVAYSAGLPYMSKGAFDVIYYSVTIIAVGVTVVYVFHFARAWARGASISGIKLICHAVALPLLYYAWAGLGDLPLGIAIWELFHDVQYFAITWQYNTNLVNKGKIASRPMRFLFQPRLWRILVYMALIYAYGSFAYGSRTITWDAEIWEMGQMFLLAFISTSTLMHFYFDGFIWKVRRADTQAALDIESGGPDRPDALSRIWTALLGGASKHARSALHVLFFVVPIGFLFAVENAKSALVDRDEIVYRKALVDITPTCLDAQKFLAEAYVKAGRLDDAAATYEAALKDHPRSTSLFDALGTLLASQGKLDQALVRFQESIRIDGENIQAHQNLGHLYTSLGQPDRALPHYERAVQLEPDDPASRMGLAQVFYRQGKIEEAAGHFRRFVELKPDSALGHYSLGLTSIARKQYADAAGQFRRAVELNSEYGDAHYQLALALGPLGQAEDAIKAFESAIQSLPDRADIHNDFGNALFKAGQHQRSVAQYQEAVRLRPDFAQAHYNLGILLTGLTRLDEAIVHYTHVIQIDPNHAKAHNNLGLLFAQQGRFRKAAVHFRQAVRIQPDYEGARRNLQAVEAQLNNAQKQKAPATQPTP